MLLAAAFAIAALVLTCVGVYGVLAYAVATRRHEFGVRRALGAGTPQVLREVFREGLVFTLIGSRSAWPVRRWPVSSCRISSTASTRRDPIAYAPPSP